MAEQLQKDENGNIIVCPLVGYTTHRVAGINVILTVDYVETPEDLEHGRSKSIQLGLTAPMCLELAETLSNAAKGILEETTPPGTSVQ